MFAGRTSFGIPSTYTDWEKLENKALKIYFFLPYERKIRLHVKNISPSTLQATKSRGCSAFFDNFFKQTKKSPGIVK